MADPAIDTANVSAQAPNEQTQNVPTTGSLVPPTASPVAFQQPAAPVIPPHVGKLAAAGHIFNTLAGTQNQYQIDPKTGMTIATPVPNKPGQMFKNMLAGALMGGATGGQDFGTGLVRGGNAVLQDQRQQDLVRRGQAKDQFNTQMEAQRNQREQTGFESSEQLKKAEIAHMNLQTVRENQLIQGESFKMHAEQSDFGKAQVQPFLDAGLKPVYRDVPESQMHDLMKNTPSVATLMWEPTGVKTGIDANGKPTYESTYTAVDPTGTVKVTSGMLDTFKKSGMEKYDPGLFDTLKPGAELDARQYMTLINRSQSLMNQKLAQDKTTAEIDELTQRGKQAQAAAAKDYAERDNYLEGKNKAGAFNKALANLNKVGDFDKLPAGDKLILGESAKDAAKNALEVYKTAKTNNDEATATSALQDYQFYDGLTRSSLSPKNNPASAAAGTPQTPQQAEAAKIAQTVSAQQKENADKDLVDDYMGSNKRLMMEATTDPTKKLIYQTLKKHDKDWNTTEKAEFIRGASNQSQNNAGLKNKPVGAAGTAKGADGKLHWASSTGQDLGLAE